MFKKAQNLIEISLLLCVVVLIGFSVMTIYNGKKTELTELSKTKKSQVTTAGNLAFNEEDIVQYNPIETAGSNALTKLKMCSDAYKAKMSNITYKTLKEAMTSEEKASEDLASLGNQLIEELGLDLPEFSEDNVGPDTLTSLTKIMNEISSPDYDGNKELAEAFTERFETVLGKVKIQASE